MASALAGAGLAARAKAFYGLGPGQGLVSLLLLVWLRYLDRIPWNLLYSLGQYPALAKAGAVLLGAPLLHRLTTFYFVRRF